jgi:hypothetical protein
VEAANQLKLDDAHGRRCAAGGILTCPGGADLDVEPTSPRAAPPHCGAPLLGVPLLLHRIDMSYYQQMRLLFVHTKRLN